MSVRPPAEWLVSDSFTLFQPCTKMSGWWLASSAASATRLTNAIASAKFSNFQSRTISSPSRSQERPTSFDSISSSLSSSAMSFSLDSEPAPLSTMFPCAALLQTRLMRIVSLVPSATEMLFALGLGADLIAVTHECDYPPAALELPKITRDRLPPGLSAAQIDAAVKERTLAGESIYELDTGTLANLRPDLIVTQAPCAGCAASYDDVRQPAKG